MGGRLCMHAPMLLYAVGGIGRRHCEPPMVSTYRLALPGMPNEYDKVMVFHRQTLHIRDKARELETFLRAAADHDAFYRDIRMQFLSKELDEVDFKRELYIRERATDKKIAMHELYSMFSSVGIDMLHRLADADRPRSVVDEMIALRAYFNKHSHEIRRRFGSKCEILETR